MASWLDAKDRLGRTMCEQMEKIKAEGVKEGMAREARTAAENMRRMGLGYDMIARYLGRDEKQIREILAVPDE